MQKSHRRYSGMTFAVTVDSLPPLLLRSLDTFTIGEGAGCGAALRKILRTDA